MTRPAPGGDMPDDNMPDDNIPSDPMPGDDMPSDDMPSDDMPSDDMPDENTPGNDMPGDDMPGDDMPGDDMPGDDMPPNGGPGPLPPACAAVDGDLVELALGTLTGKARVAALAHLDGCSRCSAEVEELSIVADLMVHLAPSAEPPVGFEARVFERLGLLQPSPAVPKWPFRMPRRLLAPAAAVVVVLAFGLGALVGTHERKPTSTSSPIELASIVSGGKSVGRVLVYAGNPTWLFMYMYDFDWHGTLRCQVMVDNGPPIVLGRFWLSDGKGAWADSVNQPAGRLVQARVLSASGKVLAVANLT